MLRMALRRRLSPALLLARRISEPSRVSRHHSAPEDKHLLDAPALEVTRQPRSKRRRAPIVAPASRGDFWNNRKRLSCLAITL